ncbi:MAG: HEAT repeat domain-containing protein [Myxococcales bacterium]|nr:HEAT repeat domain-containing protein [Myxococcales bacterium]
MAAAAAAKARSAARELRAIADGAMDVDLRGAATEALAAIGDVDAVPLLLTILERDAGANIELTGSAAHALAVLDAKADLARVVAAWLAAGKAGKAPADRAKTWAALIAASGAPVPSAIAEIGKLVVAGEPRVRGAACRALGTAATADGAAWKPLGKGLADADASVRATCATAIARAAAGGARSRATFWLLTPLLRDRDERVRAAVVLALGRLDPKRGLPELLAATRDKSALVQTSLAEALVRAGELDRAVALLGHEQVGVRQAAALALAKLAGSAGQAKLASHVDVDVGVRLVVIGVLTDRAALAASASDPDPAVAAAAILRLVVVSGREATMTSSVSVVAEAAAGTAARVQAAGAWLAAP